MIIRSHRGSGRKSNVHIVERINELHVLGWVCPHDPNASANARVAPYLILPPYAAFLAISDELSNPGNVCD